MSYKANQNWKDLVESPLHKSMTRRDLLKKGLATGVLSLGLPENFWGGFLNRAYAAAGITCPSPTRTLGAIGQIFASGGPTMGARFIGEDQAAMMTPTIAANYGISGTNLLKLGPNLVIDTTSPFGAVLLQGPPGFAGGPAGWQTTVLNKISGGGHRGAFNADDGAGVNTGLMGGVTPFRSTQLGKDLRIGASNKLANWAGGLPASAVSGGNNLTPANLARTFSISPAAAGLITEQAMTDSADAATELAAAMAGVMDNANRNGSQKLLNTASCSLYGNSVLADPAFGANLFTPTGITQLTSALTVASLTTAEQALLSSYFQSASGVIGSVVLQLNGRDYHGQNPQTVIAPADIEEARAIVMFLAACHASQSKGAFIYLSNGQAIAGGVQSVTATVDGVALTLNAPLARGDAGGSYNAGLIIFYDPAGAPPTAQFTGTLSSNNGNVKSATAVSASNVAVSGLYLSALSWINGGTIPQSAATAMNVSNPATIALI